MTEFALVHGGQHGAWCFEALVRELAVRGHRAEAMDLPIGDPGAGAAEYADVVCRSITDMGSGVVLVGHSMGGLVIPLVASRRPVAMLVFLCAAVPEPGRSHWQVKREEPGESPGPGAAEIWGQPGDRHLASCGGR